MPRPSPIRCQEGFAFVLNPFHFAGSLPLELAPGVALDKATPPERERIQTLVKELGGLAKWGMLFDHEPIPRDVRDSPEWNHILPPRETYWVIRFRGGSQLIQNLCHTSQLCDCEFELGAVFPPEGTSVPQIIFPGSFFHYTEVQWRGEAQRLDADDVSSIHSLHFRLTAFQAAPQEDAVRRSVVRLFDKFTALSAGKRYGDLPLLGHFVLIEGLITHDPHQSGDSLTHQFSTKMPLLMRKFTRPLTLTDYIDEDDPAKAWKLLYKLRSRIAHGGPGFSAASDSRLRNPVSVLKLVRESLKRIFVLALHEPEFLFELKAC